jgi:hypothetical protein
VLLAVAAPVITKAATTVLRSCQRNIAMAVVAHIVLCVQRAVHFQKGAHSGIKARHVACKPAEHLQSTCMQTCNSITAWDSRNCLLLTLSSTKRACAAARTIATVVA